jgi:aryl-phospho-beta-D-glucosidase BglC (GH1 family)
MENNVYLYIQTNKMKAQQNIHQFNLTAQRAISIWSDSLCGSDTVIGFTYNNEPKQGGTEV